MIVMLLLDEWLVGAIFQKIWMSGFYPAKWTEVFSLLWRSPTFETAIALGRGGCYCGRLVRSYPPKYCGFRRAIAYFCS
jgi:hypothetical protein